MSARNKEVVERINAAFARNDMEAFLEHCAEEFVWDMVGAERVTGKAAVRKWMASAPPEPPTFGVDALVAEGNVVVAHGNMTMKENGVVVPYSYCDVWRFSGDRVVELRAFVIKTEKAAR